MVGLKPRPPSDSFPFESRVMVAKPDAEEKGLAKRRPDLEQITDPVRNMSRSQRSRNYVVSVRPVRSTCSATRVLKDRSILGNTVQGQVGLHIHLYVDS